MTGVKGLLTDTLSDPRAQRSRAFTHRCVELHKCYLATALLIAQQNQRDADVPGESQQPIACKRLNIDAPVTEAGEEGAEPPWPGGCSRGLLLSPRVTLSLAQASHRGQGLHRETCVPQSEAFVLNPTAGSAADTAADHPTCISLLEALLRHFRLGRSKLLKKRLRP